MAQDCRHTEVENERGREEVGGGDEISSGKLKAEVMRRETPGKGNRSGRGRLMTELL